MSVAASLCGSLNDSVFSVFSSCWVIYFLVCFVLFCFALFVCVCVCVCVCVFVPNFCVFLFPICK